MSLATNIRNLFKTKTIDLSDAINLNDSIGWHTMSGSSTYNFYKDNQYENGYSSITKLSNGFATIEPYTVDKNNKSVSSNILDRLYTPNTDMSPYDFREALMVMSLVHDKVLIRVHANGDRITGDSITGFTFLEGYNEEVVGGKRYYRLLNGERLDDSTVITLKSFNPDAVQQGFSASRAARRWTRIDDYIADYQKGFFENGAVPSGEMVITAGTATEFNDIVDMLQRKHKGASKSNNITYTHRPTDVNGKPMNSQIEWIPFSSPNKDLSLKELFDNANKKIDSVYGVPASIRGVNDSNTYASVRVDELIFVKYALQPATLKIWSKFNHELNRITGGTGLAITFELELPQLADEEKVKAEAKAVDAQTVTNLTTQGYTLESAISYVQTGNIEALKLGEIKPTELPEVTDQTEVKDTPDQPVDLSMTSQKKKKLTRLTRLEYEVKLYNVVKTRMEKQVADVIANLDKLTKAITEDDPIADDEDYKLAQGMSLVLLGLIGYQGAIEHKANVKLIAQAGIDTSNVGAFEMTPAQRAQYKTYVEKVSAGYNAQTSQRIRDILQEGKATGATQAEIKDRLTTILAEEYRIQRIATTEINKAGADSSLFSMKNAAKESGATVDKLWTHGGTDDPCEFCDELIGESAGLEENFLDLGDSLVSASGAVFENDFEANDDGGLHPNCHCYLTYKVERN